MFIEYMDTPIGPIEITASDKGICSVYFVESKSETSNNNQWTTECRSQLHEYFYGKRHTFDLSFDQAGTAFQQQVWQALCSIPFGQLASYKDIANIIGNPKAVRAVGAANGRNPLTIIVPCHRVIGSNGTLTGYASGLTRKQWLLQHESSGLFSNT